MPSQEIKLPLFIYHVCNNVVVLKSIAFFLPPMDAESVVLSNGPRFLDSDRGDSLTNRGLVFDMNVPNGGWPWYGTAPVDQSRYYTTFHRLFVTLATLCREGLPVLRAR